MRISIEAGQQASRICQFKMMYPIALVITGISKAASAVVTASNAFDADDYGVTQVTFYNAREW